MASEAQAESAVRLYENRASAYDETWHPSFTKRFISYLSIYEGQHVLDLACGTGLLSFLEADAVGLTGSVTGLDVTPGMLAEAEAKKKEAPERYSHVNFYRHDILDLGRLDALQGRSFDIITVASALVLFPRPIEAMRHWIQYLKTGGVIAVDATHPRNLISGIVLERTATRLGIAVPYHRQWSVSEETLKALLEQGGLNVDKIVTVDNQAGYGRRNYNVSDADKEFEKHFSNLFAGSTTKTIQSDMDQARRIFKEEWEKLAVDGKVEEVDAVFLGIARKPQI